MKKTKNQQERRNIMLENKKNSQMSSSHDSFTSSRAGHINADTHVL